MHNENISDDYMDETKGPLIQALEKLVKIKNKRSIGIVRKKGIVLVEIPQSIKEEGTSFREDIAEIVEVGM